MFLGEYRHSVDAKGRMAIPARFRARIERGAVLTRGVETCISVYPLETWEEKAKALAEAAIDARQRRIAERRFFGLGFDAELDAQGRIVIPARLREYAGLNGEAMVIGTRDRFEIWHPPVWEAYLDEIQNEDLSALPLPF